MKKLVINSNPQNLVVDFDEVLYITTINKKALTVKLSREEKKVNVLGLLRVQEIMKLLLQWRTFLIK